MTEKTSYLTTSDAVTARDPSNKVIMRDNPTKSERLNNWFIDPLKKLDGDDSIICLMLIFPLLEKILRYDLKLKPEQDLTLSEGSQALKALAKLISIPESEARSFWNCFRNGLMHRAMIKGEVNYSLDPSKTSDRAAKFEEDKLTVYIWKLRDTIVELLKNRGKKLWEDDNHPLPNVY